ncbi:hypothetical protein PC116_g2089 [Phytophthora cactorum]|nr:hypothetical protein PC116_g2089 [Phytophthora cactorum]
MLLVLGLTLSHPSDCLIFRDTLLFRGSRGLLLLVGFEQNVEAFVVLLTSCRTQAVEIFGAGRGLRNVNANFFTQRIKSLERDTSESSFFGIGRYWRVDPQRPLVDLVGVRESFAGNQEGSRDQHEDAR